MWGRTPRQRWLRWLGLWAVLVVSIGLLTSRLVGPLLPAAFVWSSAVVLATGILFLVAAPPSHD